jgi:iron-sulfur cluster assembly accessory protein
MIDNMIVTENCKAQLTEVSEKNKANVRYSLNGGGCSGLLGEWSFDENHEVDDYAISLYNSYFLLIDSFTMQYMDEATIDYTGDFMPAFKVSIPNTNSCGCGESFQIQV